MERVAPREPQEMRCAFCHGEVEGALPCLGCGTWVHPDCRDEVARCPTLGCTGKARDEGHLGWLAGGPPPEMAPSARSPSAKRWDTVLELALGGGLRGAAVACLVMVALVLLTRLIAWAMR